MADVLMEVIVGEMTEVTSALKAHFWMARTKGCLGRLWIWRMIKLWRRRKGLVT